MNQPQVIWSRVLASACPVCGSKKRVSHKVFEKQIKEKQIKEADTFLSLSGKTSGAPVGLTVEIITVYDDICYECGAHYTLKIEKVKTLVTGQMPGGNNNIFPGQIGNPFD